MNGGLLVEVLKVKLPLCLINWALRHESVWGSECTDPRLLDLGTSGGEWSASHAQQLYHRGRSLRYPWIGDWVGPRTDLDDVENRKFLTLPERELRPFRRHGFIEVLTQYLPGGKPRKTWGEPASRFEGRNSRTGVHTVTAKPACSVMTHIHKGRVK
jgi:hypothetical protein